MKAVRAGEKFLGASLLVLVCVGAAWAQDQDQALDTSAPAPGVRILDTSSLSSAFDSALGPIEALRRPWLSSRFNFAEFGDTHNISRTAPPGVVSFSTLGGQLTLHRGSQRSQLEIEYVGNGFLYNTESNLNTSFHEGALLNKWRGRRWSLQFGGQATYLPEGPFGLVGLSGLVGGSVTGVFSGLNQGFISNQSIFNGRAARVSNFIIGEATYALNPRLKLTASGARGTLHFLDSGFINSHQDVIRSGFDYAVTGKDSIAIYYELGLLRFNTKSGIDTHLFHFGYGRHVSGRLSFHLSAGPELVRFNQTFTGNNPEVLWTMRSTLHYTWPKSSVYTSYGRHVAAGSGVVPGSRSHMVFFGYTRRLTPAWEGNLRGGFARNSSFSQTTLDRQNHVFDSSHFGMKLGRRLGEHTKGFFSYNLQWRDANSLACIGLGCQAAAFRHVFGAGFDFQSDKRGAE